jgi:quinol monooxygenase YgiN
LQKSTNPEVFSTSGQLAELINLIGIMKVGDDLCEKWLNKEGCISFDQMNTKTIQKYIDALKKKILTQQEVTK